jgi:muramoyltetrapeptide carboxypeptidase
MFSPARLPPPVLPGQRVGVAALSGPVDGGRLDAGLEALRAWGFEPVLAENLRWRRGLFAGTDSERLEGFHRLAADSSLTAIFFARGGHGVLRILPEIHWPTLARHPRAYIGYSDLTPFLLEVVRRLGLVAFHGPMVAADLARGLDEEETASLLDQLAGLYPQRMAVPAWPRAGVVQGPLLGGCLSLLTATLGTPFAPKLAGSILFWEDVGEPLYRLDRMLTHLRLSGNLQQIAGMLIGQLVWNGEDEPSPEDWAFFEKDLLQTFSGPLARGLCCGHGSPNWTLPLGLSARMDAEVGELILGGD